MCPIVATAPHLHPQAWAELRTARASASALGSRSGQGGGCCFPSQKPGHIKFFCSHEPVVIEHKRGLHVMTRGHRKTRLQVTTLTCRGEKETRGTANGDRTGHGVPRGMSTGRARGAEFPACSLELLSGEEARGPMTGCGRGGEGRRAGNVTISTCVLK